MFTFLPPNIINQKFWGGIQKCVFGEALQVILTHAKIYKSWSYDDGYQCREMGRLSPDYSMRSQSSTCEICWQTVFPKDSWNNVVHPIGLSYNDIDNLPIRKVGLHPLPLNLDGLVFQC